MKILFVTNVPSPYRVLFFNELGKNCDLTVLYQKNSSSERDVKWQAEAGNNYRSIFMKGINTGVDNAFCPEVVKYLIDKSYDNIIICGNASPTEMLAIEWCKLFRRPYCLEGDGGFAKDGKGIKEKIKKHIIAGAQAYFATSDEHDRYYMAYGALKERIVRYPFTSVTECDILKQVVSKEKKMHIRTEMGIKAARMVLAVGQFINRKGFDVLLNVADQIEADIFIVGGEPTEEYLKLQKPNVHFVGFKTKQELKKYYAAADVFVHPTREDIWGLVVNEALAFGLPVVTTNRCIAGLEMIRDGVNGFVVPVEDADALQGAVNKALSSNFAEACLATANNYTIEKMARTHIEFLKGEK